MKLTQKQVESAFEDWYDSDDYPYENTCIEFREYDAKTKQVFVYIVGEWDQDIKQGLKKFFQKFHKRITVSRIICTYKD